MDDEISVLEKKIASKMESTYERYNCLTNVRVKYVRKKN
jgi:hypothetical protein